MRTFGKVDILVTNGGGPPAGPFESHSAEAWHDAVRHTLDSVVELTRAVLPGMKARRWGRIINVTSIAVKQPVDNLILSNSVRAAVTGFARTLANEVAPFGVTVNNVMPGYTRTKRVDDLATRNAALHGTSPESEVAAWEGQIPMRRLGDPAEFAAMVAFTRPVRRSRWTAAGSAPCSEARRGSRRAVVQLHPPACALDDRFGGVLAEPAVVEDEADVGADGRSRGIAPHPGRAHRIGDRLDLLAHHVEHPAGAFPGIARLHCQQLQPARRRVRGARPGGGLDTARHEELRLGRRRDGAIEHAREPGGVIEPGHAKGASK